MFSLLFLYYHTFSVNGLMMLNSQNFEYQIRTNAYLFVTFYHDGNVSSQIKYVSLQLTKEWEEKIQELDQASQIQEITFIVAYYQHTNDSDQLYQKYFINPSKFPQFLYFDRGGYNIIDQSLGKIRYKLFFLDVVGLMDRLFIASSIYPIRLLNKKQVSILSGISYQLYQYQDRNEVFVTYYGQQLSENYFKFKEIYRYISLVPFAYYIQQNETEKIEVKRKYEMESEKVLYPPYDIESSVQFIQNSMPKVYVDSKKAFYMIMHDELPGIIMFLKNFDQNNQILFRQFQVVAYNYSNLQFVVITPKEKNIYENTIPYLGIQMEHIPAIVYFDLSDSNTKYKFEGEINSKNIKAFVDTCLEKKSEQFLKTQQMNSQWEPGSVQELVGKDFHSEVFGNKITNHMILFYKPGLQEDLNQIFKDLAIDFKNRQLRFCQFNGVQNDIKGYKMRRLPYIMYFKADNKRDPDYYDSFLNKREISKFIEDKLRIQKDDL